MRKLFSTDDVSAKYRVGVWEDFCNNRITTLDHNYIDTGPFDASVMGASFGGLLLTKLLYSNHVMSMTPRTIKDRNNKTDKLWVNLVLSGSARVQENNYSNIERTGDISIRDASAPLSLRYEGQAEILAVELSRDRLETMLGPARNFAGLTVGGNLPTAILARQFLSSLMDLSDRLTPDAAERLTTIGIDLVAASIAKRMAIDTPKPLRGMLALQRAKAYIEATLSDTSLDPSKVAVAARVSVRVLHALFREHGRHVADWIWHRRLEHAAQRLSDPSQQHLQLGEIGYACGFTSQTHFSRRFRERYGATPREYRHAAMLAAIARDAAH